MSKTLYIYLPKKQDYLTDIVSDDYSLKENETFLEPVGEDGRGVKLPVTFDGSKWIEATPEEHNKYLVDQIDEKYAPSKVTPNANEALATLMLQVAQNKADQDKFNAQLLLQTATAQAEGK